jgi:hypothetical protein
MTPVNINAILNVAYAANVPLLLWGPPGVGKTARIEAFGKANGLKVETIIASISEPAAFGGYPVPTGDGLSMLPTTWAKKLAGSMGILFVDELTTAPPSVQAACLRVINDGVVGDLDMGRGVRRWAAANPPEQAADGSTLAPPLANRFMHINVPFDLAEWSNGFINGWAGGGYTPPPIGWESRLPMVRAAIVAFLRRRPNLAHAMPKDATGQGGAWPSPRTWTMVASVLACAEAMGVDADTAHACVAGCIGDGAAVEFVAWRRQQDLPDPEALLGGADWAVPDDGSKAYATMAAIVACVVATPDQARWTRAWDILLMGFDKHADLAVLCARSMAEALVKTGQYRLPPQASRMARMLMAIGGFGSK